MLNHYTKWTLSFTLLSLALLADDVSPHVQESRSQYQEARTAAHRFQNALTQHLIEIETTHPDIQNRVALLARHRTESGRQNRAALDILEKDPAYTNAPRDKQHALLKALRSEMFPEFEENTREALQTRKDLMHLLQHLEDASILDSESAAKVSQWQKALEEEQTRYAALLKAEGKVTPRAWFESQPRPVFRPGHTLSKLTRYGWVAPYEVIRPMAEYFGYAVQIGGYFTEKTLRELAMVGSDQQKKLALYQSDPGFHRIAVVANRYFPEPAPEGTWTRDADGNLLSSQAKSYDGTEWHPGMNLTISPLAPDALAQEMAEGRAAPLREFSKIAPAAIILNAGEYGLGIPGFALKVWSKDPRINAALEEEGSD
jgi:hypothetical protein